MPDGNEETVPIYSAGVRSREGKRSVVDFRRKGLENIFKTLQINLCNCPLLRMATQAIRVFDNKAAHCQSQCYGWITAKR